MHWVGVEQGHYSLPEALPKKGKSSIVHQNGMIMRIGNACLLLGRLWQLYYETLNQVGFTCFLKPFSLSLLTLDKSGSQKHWGQITECLKFVRARRAYRGPEEWGWG